MKNDEGQLCASSPHSSSFLKFTDQCKENTKCGDEVLPHQLPSSEVYGELFCPSQPTAGLASLALQIHPRSCSDVLKREYLGKQGHKHKKYVVLRAGSHSGPSRLEWYKTEESFTVMEKSSAKELFSNHRQGVIFLRCCIGVSLMNSPRQEYKVVLYTKDQTVVLMGKDHKEQHEWYTAIKELIEEELEDGNQEDPDEEDAGYCTLPPVSYYKQVWPVNVKLRGLGRSKALAGEILLCLTASALVLVRVGHGLDLPSVTLPLLAVRRFGHLDGSFFLELGRSAPHGPGEIWMEPRDEGSSAMSQQIHEVIREVVRALKVIPDFDWPVTPSKSNHSQDMLAFKRSQTNQRLKMVRYLENESLGISKRVDRQVDSTKVTEKILNPENAVLCSEPKAIMETEIKMDRSISGGAEGCGYMLMSPGDTHSFHQDEYMAMTSPQKNDLTKCKSLSCLQSSFSFSSGSDDHSPQRNIEQTPPPWTLYSNQQSYIRAVSAGASTSPVSRARRLTPVSLFSRSTFEPVGPEKEAVSEQTAKNCFLSCLPSCLQPKISD